MKHLKDICINFLNDVETKKEMYDFLKPVVNSIYNEIYIYIWIICFYNLILFLVILANLFLLLKLINKNYNYAL
jgi:hypothetical protein